MDCNKIYSDIYLKEVVTGYGILPSFQYQYFGEVEVYACGEEERTIDHIIKYCKLWNKQRNWYFGTFSIELLIIELLSQRTYTCRVPYIVKSYFDYVYMAG